MFKDKLKQLIKRDEGEVQEGNDKKKIENLVFFIVLLIITIVVINIIWNGNKKTNKEDSNTDASKTRSPCISIISSFK